MAARALEAGQQPSGGEEREPRREVEHGEIPEAVKVRPAVLKVEPTVKRVENSKRHGVVDRQPESECFSAFRPSADKEK